MCSRSRFRTWCAALLLTTTSVAHAEPDDASRQRARELMAEGRAARVAQQEQRALESFAAADAIMRAPTTTLEVARSQAALGLLVEAQRTARSIEVVSPDEREPPAFARAREAAATLVQELTGRIPTLTVTFTDAEAGYAARVTVDGVEVPTAVLLSGYRLNPGSHRVAASSGGQTASRDVVLAEGGSREVQLQLSSVVAAEPARSLPPPAPRREAGISSGVYALGGVALVSLGAGTALLLLAQSSKSELEATCAPGCSKARVDDVSQRYTAANVSFAVGAAAAAGAVVWLLLDREGAARRDRAAWSLDVLPASRGAGLDLHGRF